MLTIRRVGPAAILSMMALATGGCGDTSDPVRDALMGTWELHIVSETSAPAGEPIKLKIVADDGWFDDDLSTSCGRDGVLGSFSGDWREIDVELDRYPKGAAAAGSISARCITTVQPMGGFRIQAFFGEDKLVGKLTHQINRGGNGIWIPPAFVATKVHLFVGHRGPTS